MNKLERSEITLKGNVQMAGFRTFIKNAANSLNIKGFVDNLEDGSVVIVCEGIRENIKELITSIKENHPHFVRIDSIDISYKEYKGGFLAFERRGQDVPKEATMNDLFRVMTRFDEKGEILIGILNSINKKQDETINILKEFKEESNRKQDIMIEKQDIMIEKQDIMIEKQDIMIEKQDIMIEKQNETISTIQNESELTRKELGGKIDIFNMDCRDHAELNYRDIKEETKNIKEEIKNIKLSLKK